MQQLQSPQSLYGAAQPVPSSSPSFLNTVRQVFNWRPDDRDWSDIAVATLIKRIEKWRGKEAGHAEMERLDQALKYPDVPSGCITIPRSQDGRIQVGHLKNFPHVIYCKVWRWPDLQRHTELRAVPECAYHFEAKRTEVCINPTHYRRIETAQVLVRRQQHLYADVCSPASPETDTDSGFYSNPNSPESGEYVLPAEGASVAILTQQQPMQAPQLMEPQPQPMLQPQRHLPQQQATKILDYGSHTVAYQQPELLANPSAAANDASDMQLVQYEEAIHWASIRYYELNLRIGDTFQCFNTEITIDGYTQPQSTAKSHQHHQHQHQPTGSVRFSLGQLSNHCRNSTIEKVRQHIGRGVQLQFANGLLTAHNISEGSLFVHSYTLNRERQADGDAVLKMPPGSSLVIFNNVTFSQQLGEAANHGFEAVYALTKWCTVRISFVKGWGVEYHRPDVTSTPCWVEVHMNGALKWLDKVLTTLGSPTMVATSVS